MADPIWTRAGHAIAKVLGIEIATADETVYAYFEHEPTAADWIRGYTPSVAQVRRYVWNLFPFLHWIGFYNGQWLVGDLVAGTLHFPVFRGCADQSQGSQSGPW